jgi:hypothetical protein
MTPLRQICVFSQAGCRDSISNSMPEAGKTSKDIETLPGLTKMFWSGEPPPFWAGAEAKGK